MPPTTQGPSFSQYANTLASSTLVGNIDNANTVDAYPYSLDATAIPNLHHISSSQLSGPLPHVSSMSPSPTSPASPSASPSKGGNKGAHKGRPRQWAWARSSDWDAQRERITELYRDRNMHLHKVVEIMERERNFHASARMYKTRIAKWSIDKNYKAADVACMLVLKRRRAREGKDSAFILRGRKVDWAKIEQYLKRDSTLLRRLNAGDDLADLVPNPNNIKDIVCRTPSPEPASQQPLPPAPRGKLANQTQKAQQQQHQQQHQQQQQYQQQQQQQYQQQQHLHNIGQQQLHDQHLQAQQHGLPPHAVVVSSSPDAMPYQTVSPSAYHHNSSFSHIMVPSTTTSSFAPNTPYFSTAATQQQQPQQQPTQQPPPPPKLQHSVSSLSAAGAGQTAVAMGSFAQFPFTAPHQTMPRMHPSLLPTAAPALTVSPLPASLSSMDAMPPTTSATATNMRRNAPTGDHLANEMARLVREYAESSMDAGLWHDQTGRGHYASVRAIGSGTKSLTTWHLAQRAVWHKSMAARDNENFVDMRECTRLLDCVFRDEDPSMLFFLFTGLSMATEIDVGQMQKADPAALGSPADAAERSLVATLSRNILDMASLRGMHRPLAQLFDLLHRALTSGGSQQPLQVMPAVFAAFAAALRSLVDVFAERAPASVDRLADNLSMHLARLLRESDDTGGERGLNASTASAALLGLAQSTNSSGRPLSSSLSLSPVLLPSFSPSYASPRSPLVGTPSPESLLQRLTQTQHTYTRMRCHHTFMAYLAERTIRQATDSRGSSISSGSLGSSGSFGGSFDAMSYTTTPRPSVSSTGAMSTLAPQRHAGSYAIYGSSHGQQQPQQTMGHHPVFYTSAGAAATASTMPSMSTMSMATTSAAIPATTAPALSSSTLLATTPSSVLMPVQDLATTPRTTPFAGSVGLGSAHNSPHSGLDSRRPHQQHHQHQQQHYHPHHTHAHEAVTVPQGAALNINMTLGHAAATNMGMSGGSDVGGVNSSLDPHGWNGSLPMHLGMSGGSGVDSVVGGVSSGGSNNAPMSMSNELEDAVGMSTWM